MNITSAQYLQNTQGENITVKTTIDGVEMHVPIDSNNRHYAAILEWAKEDGNEIQAAE